jgi:PPOX class probable F420-dependent enzyme
VSDDLERSVHPLLVAPAAPAVLTTYRKDGSAHVSPVWVRFFEGAFEIVIAKGDVKLRHLERNPDCVFVVFETAPPFRGIEVRTNAELVETDVAGARRAIAGRYLGEERGQRFAVQRKAKPGVLLRLTGEWRVWDLSAILPD